MDVVGLGFLLVFLLGMLVIAALGLSMLRALRGQKVSASPGSTGSLLSNAERAAVDALSSIRHGLTHGQMFDQAEALGGQLVSGGYMADAEWQPIFESIAKSLTHRAHAPAAAPATAVTAPATEAHPTA